MKNIIKLFGLLILIQTVSCKKETSSKHPVLTTDSINGISINSAKIYATITSDNGEAITEKGICWGKTNPPYITDSKIPSSSGDSSFSCTLTGLYYASHYYVRAYATNSSGTGYGVVLGLTTEGGSPYSVLSTATESDTGSVVVSGTVYARYLPTKVILEYGTSIFYGDTISTVPNYVYGDTATITTATIRGLSKAKLYHFRIRSINPIGANYSNDLTLTTSGI